MSITTAARRLATNHNDAWSRGLGGNGFIVVDATTGKGGAFYTRGSRPDLTGCISVEVRSTRMTWDDAQSVLNYA